MCRSRHHVPSPGHTPSFPANLTYHSTPPMITGFMPEVYAQQPWLGLHSLDLTHTPPPDSHRKAVDVLKEEILHSTGGNVAAVVSTGQSASTSTVPKQTGQVADECPSEGIPPMSHAISPIAHSPTKCKHTRSPSLCHLQSSSSSSSGSGSRTGCASRWSSLSSSGSLGSGYRSDSSDRSWAGSPAWSQASRHEGSVHSGAASDGSIKVLSADEVLASGG